MQVYNRTSIIANTNMFPSIAKVNTIILFHKFIKLKNIDAY